MKTKLKKFSFDQIKDEFLGKKGTPKRDRYEFDLKLELLGQMIKAARLERNMTQEQLGRLVGVQKAQISKLENSMHNVTFETILKVFTALNAKVKFKVELGKEIPDDVV
jgi:DNA-binding XRE family transcriptional regulator